MEPSNDNKPRGLRALFRNVTSGHPLKIVLKVAGLYMWPPAARWDNPFSREGFRHKTRRFMRGAAAVGIVLTGHQIVHSGTGMLFPTAEDYLKSQGLDPKLAVELSDNTIRVRQHDFWGRLHAAHDLPSIGFIFSSAMINMPGQAHAIPNHDSLINHALLFTPFSNFVQCPVMLQSPEITARDTVAMLGDIPKGRIERLQITDRESQLAVAFHEFRHCASANALDGSLREADSDGTGVGLLAKTLGNPEIARTMLYARALGTEAHGHDTALAMDMVMRGRQLPLDDEAVQQATRDVFNFAHMYMSNNAFDPMPLNDSLKYALALRDGLANYGELFSPMAKRRAELYIEAVEYFMPDAWEAARQSKASPIFTAPAKKSPAAPAP
jgi:hypothetical protein